MSALARDRPGLRECFDLAYGAVLDLQQEEPLLDPPAGGHDRLARCPAARERSPQRAEERRTRDASRGDQVAEQVRGVVAVGLERARILVKGVAVRVHEVTHFRPEAVEEEAVDE